MRQLYTRELTDKEKRTVRNLATGMCANFDHEYECLLLDGPCYMCTIGLNTSNLCKYFERAVLPLDPELEAIFTGVNIKPCQWCGRKFPMTGRRAYCSEACASAAKKAATAKRVRRHRSR